MKTEGNTNNSHNTAIVIIKTLKQGRIQDFFIGGGALVSCSTSTPIKHIVFFLQNTSCIRKPQVIPGGRGVRTPCTLPLDPPLDLFNQEYDYRPNWTTRSPVTIES